jgi:PAS domain S-box-containing protein
MTNPNEKREAALLSWIYQLAPYGVITLDESFQIQSWNHWMEIHTGMRFDQLAGKNIFTLFPDLAERKLNVPFERALGGESCVLSTGLHRYLLPMASPLKEAVNSRMRQTARIAPLRSEDRICGIVVVIEDVTQRENQSEALSRQHRRDETLSWALAHFLKSDEPRKTIRQLFFKIAEHLDFDTFLVYFRDIQTKQLSLYTCGGIVAEMENDFADYPLLFGVADCRLPVIFESVQSREEPEYQILKKAHVSAAIAIPLTANERSLGLLCFATWNRPSIAADESDLLTTIAQYLATAVDKENTNLQLQKAQQELSNHALMLERNVEERTSRLKETISELETFSYTLAHDLKAPVRAMNGYCQILLDDLAGSLPPKANEIVQKLARTPRQMEALIQDLLEFSEVSRHDVVLQPIELGTVLEDVLALRIPAVRQAVTICEPLLPVRAHKILLHQVLSNLIDNAVKFVAADTLPRITIRTELVARGSPSTRAGQLLFNSPPPIPPSNDQAGENVPARVRIWVIDEGIGIPREVHQKIFGIFERGTSSEAYEGTGMGLAIVARAMQRMGGTCGVESEEGKGSRFWIELPAA